MAKMRAAQVTKPKGPFELVEREIPQPGPGDVRVKVQACGVCHADMYVKEGLWPGVAISAHHWARNRWCPGCARRRRQGLESRRPRRSWLVRRPLRILR